MGLTRFLWKYVLTSGNREDISESAKLGIICLILPASSAQAERLFSCMNFLKNDHRNLLGEAHLNDAVRLKLSKYSLRNFPYEVALKIFLDAKERRGLNTTLKDRAGPSENDPAIDFAGILDFEEEEELI